MQELFDAYIVISHPFWTFYFTKERIQQDNILKLAIIACIGFDHVYLDSAKELNIDVFEVTYCNSISVSVLIVM
ncbi:NAD-dependent formate dehydrogenase, partial [Francisella tularensis subsp. holarctica]|nr:NAD-dependent formate dehydrogenase [Francisella tularensis subsp. holarctica]